MVTIKSRDGYIRILHSGILPGCMTTTARRCRHSGFLTIILGTLLICLGSSCNINERELYPTSYVRELWHVCFGASQKGNPFIPPPIHIHVCDCVMDATRSMKDYKEMQGPEKPTPSFFKKRFEECTPSGGFPPPA